MIYLDNAATSIRPQPVIDKWVEMSSRCNANIHRAVHQLSVEATAEFESARDRVREFINAGDRGEVIFTSGATASINLVAFSYGEVFVGKGDEIIVTEAEHHSDIVPWQMLCSRKEAVLKVLGVDSRGYLETAKLDELITPRTKLVCVTHVSNVLGIVNPLKEIIALCHLKGCPVLVDGAQGIVHQKVDVRDMDCDFYAFSGHKMYAAPGTGVLYGKREWLDKMTPYMGGGEMIESVKFTGTSYAPLPSKFEAGTQNIAGVPTFKPAIEYLEKVRAGSLLQEITSYMIDALNSDGRVNFYGNPVCEADKIPLFSFSVNGAHHEDLALLLDKMGIAVRSGQMCAEPLMDRFGVTGMLRASFAPYNTMAEAEYFISSLKKAVNMLV